MVWIKRKSGKVEDVPHYEIVSAERREDGRTHIKLKDNSEGIELTYREAQDEREAWSKAIEEFWRDLGRSDENVDKRSGLQQLFEDYNK